MFSLLKFGDIGLFTCKMTLYTYHMQPIEPNATKVCIYRKTSRFWQRSSTVGGARFSSKCMFFLLNREEWKIRQVRRPPPLIRQKLMINLNEIGMKKKNTLSQMKVKDKEKLRNTENSNIMKFAWNFRHLHFPCHQEYEKTSKIYDKSFEFIERLKELKSWSG